MCRNATKSFHVSIRRPQGPRNNDAANRRQPLFIKEKIECTEESQTEVIGAERVNEMQIVTSCTPVRRKKREAIELQQCRVAVVD